MTSLTLPRTSGIGTKCRPIKKPHGNNDDLDPDIDNDDYYDEDNTIPTKAPTDYNTEYKNWVCNWNLYVMS